METKSKGAPSILQPHKSVGPGNGGDPGGDILVIDETGIDDLMEEEVPGSGDTIVATTGGVELTEAEKHRPVSSPPRKRETTESSAETDPTVDAGFANLSSLHNEREFWGAVTRAIGPLILNTVKKTGTSIVKTGFKKLSPTLAYMLRLQGVSESQIQQLESRQESSSTESSTDEREFWPAIASAIVPVLMPHAKKLAGKAAKKGASWFKSLFESAELESGAEMESMSLELEGMFMEHAESVQMESGSEESAGDQREFWKALARKLVPALSPIAKAAASAALTAGKSIAASGLKKLTPALANLLRLEGFTESQIESIGVATEESSTESTATEQREFWGAIASAIVPVLMPHAKKLAGKAVKKGSSWVKKIFESTGQESGEEMESVSIELEGLFIEQATSGEESSGEVSAGEREFWRGLARKIVPVLKPVAKAAAGMAVKAGTSWLTKMFESGQQESGQETEAMSKKLEDMFMQQANAQESDGASEAEQREFWGGVAKKLVARLSPIAKAVADAAAKPVKGGIKGVVKKLSPTLAHLLRLEGFSESTIEQLESSKQESAPGDAISDQREFWGSIVRTLVPVLKPFAKKLGTAAVSAGGKLVKSGIRKIFESGQQESGEDAIAQTGAFLQQLEALEVIIDTDDRVQVNGTSAIPFRRICHLSIKAADGSAFLGTGFFIGPRTVITAGHCVYDSDHGGWPQEIVVSPGRNGANRPFGQFVATSFSSVEGWTENQDRDCDYGVIHLNKTDKVSPNIGCFGFGVFSNQALTQKQFSVTGYPGDKPSGTMWFHSRKATTVNPTTIVYDIDTVGGQSGSAVYDQNRHVVAIHTNGASTGNSATRITQAVFNNLKKWRSQGGA